MKLIWSLLELQLHYNKLIFRLLEYTTNAITTFTRPLEPHYFKNQNVNEIGILIFKILWGLHFFFSQAFKHEDRGCTLPPLLTSNSKLVNRIKLSQWPNLSLCKHFSVSPRLGFWVLGLRVWGQGLTIKLCTQSNKHQTKS